MSGGKWPVQLIASTPTPVPCVLSELEVVLVYWECLKKLKRDLLLRVECKWSSLPEYEDSALVQLTVGRYKSKHILNKQSIVMSDTLTWSVPQMSVLAKRR